MSTQYIKPKSKCLPYKRHQPRTPSITANCAQCGKEFHPLPSEVKKGRGRFCSRPCFDLAKRRPWQERFWDYVDKSGECWIWTGSKVGGKRRLPYGKFTYAPIVGEPQITAQAHRLSWELVYGPISEGKHILHKCDNPSCVNPDHLFIGTNQDNIDDKINKGRQAKWKDMQHRNTVKGSRHHHAALTEDQVREIRERYAQGDISQTDLAKKYGVHQTVISNIILRKAWKHI